ncbi:MAG: hypothetical protein WDW36_007574 [Sanguina aurantia]
MLNCPSRSTLGCRSSARPVCLAGPQRRAVRAASAKNGTISLPTLPPLDAAFEKAHAFKSFSNWIVPGSVMLGRYPHVEPSLCTSRKQGEQQLTAILEAGVTTFISLQAELPPQSDLTLAGLNGFLPYRATAELIQAAYNDLPPMDSMNGLRNPSLDKFLPPKKKPTTSWNARQLHFLHSPIVDLSIPQKETLRALIADMEQRVANKEILYIHCWGGRGRAGTVGACLLAALYNIPAEQALARVQRAFDTRKDMTRRSPETDEQLAFVREFIGSQ